MSVAVQYEIACDECGCVFDVGEPSLKALRILARQAGWYSRPIGDWCPDHWPDELPVSNPSRGES